MVDSTEATAVVQGHLDAAGQHLRLIAGWRQGGTPQDAEALAIFLHALDASQLRSLVILTSGMLWTEVVPVSAERIADFAMCACGHTMAGHFPDGTCGLCPCRGFNEVEVG